MDTTLNIKIERVHRLNGDGATRAFVDISINDAILIKSLRVVKGSRGLFVAMPGEQGKNKKWYETVRCLNDEVRLNIFKEVLNSYEAQEN